LQQPLGRSNPFYKYAPAWNAHFLKQPLSASVNYWTISGSQGIEYRNIPQLEANIRFSVNRNSRKFVAHGGSTHSGEGFGDVENEYMSQIEFSDGSEIAIENDNFIVLQIEESNTFFENDNFEVEFYRVQTVDGKEILTPLTYFNGDVEIEADEVGLYNNTTCIQSYLTIKVDKEIDPNIICPLINTDKVRNVFDSRVFKCEALPQDAPIDIYDDVDDTEDVCN